MSDKDSDHMLLELQEARAEIDRLRELLRWRKFEKEKPKNSGDYLVTNSWDTSVEYWDGNSWGSKFHLHHWRPIGPLPGGE